MTAPQMPKAVARSLPRKVALTVDSAIPQEIIEAIEKEIGAKRAREAMRAVAESARAARMLEVTKRTTPATKVRRRPQRSPIRPTVRSSAAKIIA